MSNRRAFIRTIAGATAGLVFTSCDLLDAAAAKAAAMPVPPQAAGATPGAKRVVTVGGKRAKVIDVHAHCQVPEVADLLKGTPLEGKGGGGRGGNFVLGPKRIDALDARGIDVQLLNINGFWWYAADRDLADKIVKLQNAKMAEWCSAHSDRFACLTSVSLQHPDLAAAQLEHAVKEQGFKGAAIGGSVMGEPLSSPRFDPFWAKAQELDVLVFMHPTNAEFLVKEDALKGKGDLGNIIGDPLETATFLSHMIYEGTLDKFPGLKICAAHGGGFLPSYLGRFDVACEVRANAACANKKHPKQYLQSQIWADTIINEQEGFRHLVAEMGPSQVVFGTDIPFNWPDSLDFILHEQMSDEDKVAILGGNLGKLLKI
ncbi:MAG TPA: amidohydrolase family protein [Candidatus Acidoferrales bacterium]|jgi:aminocarboxymuconate-semialdehyde decarboxylase|nr:amidohydrolase family protein [Candidatus Acidoferrales bacterium]